MTNEICPHCQLPRQGAHSCMDSMRAEIELLRGNLSLAEEGLANYALEVERLQTYNVAQGTLLLTVQQEVERLREVLTIPNITPDTTSSALFIRTLSEHEKGQPVNAQDLINALMWRVKNQRREIERLTCERGESRAAIEQLHAAVKTAQELAATRLIVIERLHGLIDSRDRALGFVPLDEVHASEPSEPLPSMPIVCRQCGSTDTMPWPASSVKSAGASRDASSGLLANHCWCGSCVWGLSETASMTSADGSVHRFNKPCTLRTSE